MAVRLCGDYILTAAEDAQKLPGSLGEKLMRDFVSNEPSTDSVPSEWAPIPNLLIAELESPL